MRRRLRLAGLASDRVMRVVRLGMLAWPGMVVVGRLNRELLGCRDRLCRLVVVWS